MSALRVVMVVVNLDFPRMDIWRDVVSPCPDSPVLSPVTAILKCDDATYSPHQGDPFVIVHPGIGVYQLPALFGTGGPGGPAFFSPSYNPGRSDIEPTCINHGLGICRCLCDGGIPRWLCIPANSAPRHDRAYITRINR